ncbi:universal stress protein [Sciscionella sediminilitoris]|uniref:universal stress protein n=1 Tax=Sciscionella sediminilitoris TaxID=1445613 RepID=UPI0004DF6FD5|nr:universal stress protein [Sciscionella sp. SE31]
MGTYGTVLVGTDGSDSSYRAVDRAAEIARDTSAKLVVVCAYYPASKREVDAAADELGDIAYQVVGSTPAEETLRTASERATAQGAADIVTDAVVGEPVKTLIEAVERHKANLLVTGNRGLNTLAGRILGSVPANVTRQAPADVLIVHTTGR